eukprot:jgi/Botrbrau1/11189/Bobra.0214s0014.1
MNTVPAVIIARKIFGCSIQKLLGNAPNDVFNNYRQCFPEVQTAALVSRGSGMFRNCHEMVRKIL